MKRNYRVTFSSKIDKIGENVINSDSTMESACSSGVVCVAIPNTLSDVSENAFYECENLKTVTVGKETFNREEGSYELPIIVNGKTVSLKFNSGEEECTVLPFELKIPLCPEDMQ